MRDVVYFDELLIKKASADVHFSVYRENYFASGTELASYQIERRDEKSKETLVGSRRTSEAA